MCSGGLGEALRKDRRAQPVVVQVRRGVEGAAEGLVQRGGASAAMASQLARRRADDECLPMLPGQRPVAAELALPSGRGAASERLVPLQTRASRPWSLRFVSSA